MNELAGLFVAAAESDDEKIRGEFFKFLSRGAYTVKRARVYLRARGVAADKINSLVGEALELKLLDDALYCELFADGHKSWGKRRIVYELGRRGLSVDAIGRAAAGIGDDDELERAALLIKPWQKSGVEPRKIINRLISRGFSYATARKALDS